MHKTYALINIIGLSIGLAVSILIFLFIRDELSFDNFHTKAENIYRINGVEYLSPGELQSETDAAAFNKYAYLPLPLRDEIKSSISEIKEAVRFSEAQGIVRYNDKIFEEKINFTDNSFLEMFSFQPIEGTAATALSHVNNVVISEKIADKYFGNENPIGKYLQIKLEENENAFLVASVVKNVPANSSINFEILLPIENKPFYNFHKDRWQAFNTPLFVELHENVNPQNFQINLTAFSHNQFADIIEKRRIKSGFGTDDKIFELDATPLRDVHLDTSVAWEKVSDPDYSLILGGIAFLIFTIAGINYIILTLSASNKRSREIGVKKVLGAKRFQIAIQFFGEAQILALISALFSLVIIEFILPSFNEFTGKEISLSFLNYLQLAAVIACFSFLAGTFAGSYPALYLSKLQPVKIFKNNPFKVRTGLTKILIVLQFSLSSFLVICSTVMYNQFEFTGNKDLGFKKEQIIVIPAYHSANEQGEITKERLRKSLSANHDIVNITGSSSAFGKGWSILGVQFEGKDLAAYSYRVDPEFISTLEIKMIEGRNFNEEMSLDENAIIINETMARLLGKENPAGEQLIVFDDNTPSIVIGVVKDYHFLSLENEVEPMFLYTKDYDPITSILIKVKPGRIQSAIAAIEAAWHDAIPNKPFNFSFLDEDVAQQYNRLTNWMNIMGIATAFALLIACMGLFGLTSITTVQKTKEIGIRKILGASVTNIISMLSMKLIILVAFANMIAWPTAYYVMNNWLDGFAYKTDLTLNLFLSAGFFTLIIAVITISYQSVKTAMANPVESLKYE